jgi:hypothetical protein
MRAVQSEAIPEHDEGSGEDIRRREGFARGKDIERKGVVGMLLCLKQAIN